MKSFARRRTLGCLAPALLGTALTSCQNAGPGPAGNGGGDGGGAAAPALKVERLASGRRAIHAVEELEDAAKQLLSELGGSLTPGSPYRLAMYFVTLDGRRHLLGESVARDLTAHLVARADPASVEVYTRRKLSRVLEEQRLQLSETFDADTLVRIGKLAGVSGIVVGRMAKERGDAHSVRFKVIDIETARTAAGAKVTIPLAPRPVSGIVPAGEGAEVVARQLVRGASVGDWKAAVLPFFLYERPFRRGETFAGDVELALRRHIEAAGGRVFTRDVLDQVLAEHALQRDDLFDEDTRARAGRLVGANVVIAGTAEVYPSVTKWNVVALDVETGRVLSAVLVNEFRGAG